MQPSHFIFKPNDYPLDPGFRLIEASAGTGKTFSLSHLVLRLLTEKEYSINEFLVISFTKATAIEIKSKISSRLIAALKGLEKDNKDSTIFLNDKVLVDWLNKKVKDQVTREYWISLLLKALETIDNADITTIHGFCSKNLQREAIAIGGNIDSKPISEEDNRELILRIIHEYWRDQLLDLSPLHLQGLRNAGLSLKTLTNSLYAIDNDPSLNLNVDNGIINPLKPLSSQFTECLRGYWDDFVIQWHKEGNDLEKMLKQKAIEWKAMGIENTRPFSPNPRKKRSVEISEWINQYNLETNTDKSNGFPSYKNIRENLLLRNFFHPIKIAEVERRNNLIESSLTMPELQNAIANLWDKPAEMVLQHALCWSVQKLKDLRKDSGYITYSDQLKALDPESLDSDSKDHIIKTLRQKYKVVLVDEFQDTDPIQWRILNKAFRESKLHLLIIVGDPKQSIYKFRGGDLSTYLQARDQADRIDSLITNYRATPELLNGLNTLMRDGLKYSRLDIVPLIPGSKNNFLSFPSNTVPIEILDLQLNERIKTSPSFSLPSKAEVDTYIPPIVANYIIKLLEKHKGQLKLNDICILVNRHEQGENIRSGLANSNLPTRLLNQGDILDSNAAINLQIFLDCLANPKESKNIKLLACSPLIQWDIENFKSSEISDNTDKLVIKCIDLSERLQKIGLLGCLYEILNIENTAKLTTIGRFLEDLKQCTEIIEEEIHNKGLDATQAARWFRQKRQQRIEAIPENRRLNSDVEEHAINIITIHRSKGLQFKIVICPYLWQSSPLPTGPLWRIKDSQEWHISLTPGWGRSNHVLKESRNESIEESERLAYVALTRAETKLLIIWSMAKNQENNPLRNILFGKKTTQYDPQKLTKEKIIDWVNPSENNIQVTTLKTTKSKKKWKQSKSMLSLDTGPIPQRILDKSWGRHSYSSWISTKGNHSDFLESPKDKEDGKDTEQNEMTSTKDNLDNSGLDLSKNKYTQSPLANFPRGPLAGECLHRIFEKLDFDLSVSNNKTQSLIEEELEISGINNSLKKNVQDLLERILNIPLGKELENFQFNQLDENRRITELSFDLSMSIGGNPITQREISKIFKKTSAKNFKKKHAESIQNLNISSRGFLTGSIDLVFTDKKETKEARWWVVDWKSNWLGEINEENQERNCSPIHYSRSSMENQMISHNYHLQAYIYLVALHRYLKWRLVNYDPSKHLGGYIYIFLRGVPNHQEIRRFSIKKDIPGIIIERTSLEQVIELDSLIKRGG